MEHVIGAILPRQRLFCQAEQRVGRTKLDNPLGFAAGEQHILRFDPTRCFLATGRLGWVASSGSTDYMASLLVRLTTSPENRIDA